jgi:hypothetical protein
MTNNAMQALQPNRGMPDFDNMTWLCPCCKQNRTDKFIKVMIHDVSGLFGLETGCMMVNVKYCIDVPSCVQKSHDREWVIHNYFKKFVDNENAKIEV